MREQTTTRAAAEQDAIAHLTASARARRLPVKRAPEPIFGSRDAVPRMGRRGLHARIAANV